MIRTRSGQGRVVYIRRRRWQDVAGWIVALVIIPVSVVVAVIVALSADRGE